MGSLVRLPPLEAGFFLSKNLKKNIFKLFLLNHQTIYCKKKKEYREIKIYILPMAFEGVYHGHGIGDFSETGGTIILGHVDTAVPGCIFTHLLDGSWAFWS